MLRVITAGTAECMPVDQVLTRFQVRAHRAIAIDASVEQVYAAMMTTDLTRSRWLRWLSPVPNRDHRWNQRMTIPDRLPVRLLDLRRYGVVLLAENPPEGIALSAVARIWSTRPAIQRVPAEFFGVTEPPGFVSITATFETAPITTRRTRLDCEIRFHPHDAGARRRFRLGWPLGRLLVALAQREVLNLIARRAVALAARADETE